MSRKNVALALVVLLSLILSGCWNKGELSELAIVLAAGTDWTDEGNIRVTVQIAKPPGFAVEGGAKGALALTWVVSAEGKTIAEAFRYLAMRVPRHIYLGHCVILVIGEEMARVGMNMVTNFFFRQVEPRETMWVMVARGNAEEVLKATSSLEKSSAQAAGFLTKVRTGLAVQLREYEEMLASEGQQPVLPIVRVSPMDSAGAELEVRGAAVFKEDRMIGWLDDSDTRGLLWLRGEIRKEVITVPSPGDPDRMVSVEVKNADTKITSRYEEGKPQFTVTLLADCDLAEQQSVEDITGVDKIADLEREIAAGIEQRAASALEKAQKEYAVDIFGFGEVFHRQCKKEWRELKCNWDDEFKRAAIRIQARARVRRVGIMLQAPEEQRQEKTE